MLPSHSGLSRAFLNDLNFSTPFLVLDPSVVEHKYYRLKSLLPELKQIHYAVKANPSIEVCRTIKDLGGGFDIASIGELKLLNSIGVDPASVLFSNPIKPVAAIREGYARGIRHYAFDSEEELLKIAYNAPGASVYCRIGVSDTGSMFQLSSKFGCSPEQAVKLLEKAGSHGLKPFGLTFHVGSQSINAESWRSALSSSAYVMEQLEDKGVCIESLNIGGGFPARYNEPVPGLKKLTGAIRDGLKRLPYTVDIYAEPGRFLVAESAVIASSVIARETRAGREWLFLDMGVFQGLMEALEIKNWPYKFESSITTEDGLLPFVLTGPTCDPYDTIAEQALLPAGINIGDRVYIRSAGAYTTAYASSFNGFDPPAQYTIRAADKKEGVHGHRVVRSGNIG